MKVIFKCDCQLNDDEWWIAAGSIYDVADIHHMKDDCTPVIITHAYDYEGNYVEFNPVIEFYMNYCLEIV